MANTDVTLKDNKGVLVPSLDSVRVVAGDTITFSTVDGRAALAYFSPDAAAGLSPNPANPCPIATGAKAHFSFTTSDRGAYSVYFGYGAGDAPDSFPGGHSEILRLEINAPEAPPFSGPTDSMGTGHSG
jgi:hypothetical protein